MRNIGIIGGGIGGVAAAAALYRLGIQVTVYERAPRLEEVGAGMMLWPNATRVLKTLGLLDDVARRSATNTNFLVRASSGEVLMNIALGQFDVPALCTRRSDLLASLLSVVPPERIRLGREFSHLEQSKSKVRVHFADGCVEEHDAVIGADGIRSRARAQLFGIFEPVYRGYTVWRGVAPYNGSALRRGDNSETWGHGSRFGILDIGQGRFTWYATANIPQRAALSGEPLSELRTRFAGWHEPIPTLIESADLILENGAYDLPPLPRWTAGRVTLLGDAAHPMLQYLAQGGCMAIEDAVVLADQVQAAKDDFAAAFVAYQKQRYLRTTRVQMTARFYGDIYHAADAVRDLRRQLLAGRTPEQAYNGVAWLYDGI